MWVAVTRAAVKHGGSLQQEEDQEAGRDEEHGVGDRDARALAARDQLREDVEERHAQHCARAEPQEEVHTVAHAHGGQPSQTGGEEGERRHQDSEHALSLTDTQYR